METIKGNSIHFAKSLAGVFVYGCKVLYLVAARTGQLALYTVREYPVVSACVLASMTVVTAVYGSMARKSLEQSCEYYKYDASTMRDSVAYFRNQYNHSELCKSSVDTVYIEMPTPKRKAISKKRTEERRDSL